METVKTSDTEEIRKPPKKKGAARETLYRVTLQNQMDSIGIADQKSNIIIGINTILISIIIATLGIGSSGRGLEFIDNLHLSLPFTILLITSVVTSVIALLTVRPVTRPWQRDDTEKVFFLAYNELSIDEFQELIKRISVNNESVHHALNNDMYFLGRIVIRKFRLLRIAYMVFLTGMLITVITFLILRYI